RPDGSPQLDVQAALDRGRRARRRASERPEQDCKQERAGGGVAGPILELPHRLASHASAAPKWFAPRPVALTPVSRFYSVPRLRHSRQCESKAQAASATPVASERERSFDDSTARTDSPNRRYCVVRSTLCAAG